MLRPFGFSKSWPVAFISSPGMQNFFPSSGCLLAVLWCWRGFVLCFRRTMIRPLPSLLQYAAATSTRLCSLVLDWEGWLWEFGVLHFQQYLLLHLYLRAFMITYPKSGWTGCWFLGFFSPHLGFFCQSSQLWDLLMDIHPLCSTALRSPAGNADAATSEWDPLQEEILHLKIPC